MKRLVRGFTLIEILAVVAIALVLLALLVPVGNACLEKARAVREIGGARSAIMAWQSYASENNGEVLPAYLSANPVDANKVTVLRADGSPVSFPAKIRYPFRLAPYMDYQMKGSLLVNKQKILTNEYDVSMYPSFGINLTFVGGDSGGGTDLKPSEENYAKFGKFVVTRINEIHAPSRLLVFASARMNDGAKDHEGYNAVKSPYFQGERWVAGEFDKKRPDYDYGFVDFRYNKQAVGVMADGHAQLFKTDQLRDMRLWSNQAAEADDPNWTLKPL